MALSLTQIMQLCAFAALLACGQLLFKFAAGTLPPLTSLNGMTSLVSNTWFWAALILYGTAMLLWILILQQIPLSLAYPFVALGFVIVPLASALLFKESLNIAYAAGVILIVAGLGVIAATAPR